MATFYVRSGATGAATGADWTNAFTTLAAAFTAMAAGDTVYLSDDHAETQSTAMTLTSPGTAGAACKVLCASNHTSVPPTALWNGVGAPPATISTTGTASMTLSGFAYFYGITFSSAGSGSTAITIGQSANSCGLIFEACKVALTGAGSTARIALGATSAGIRDQFVEWRNTTVSFGNVAQSIQVASPRFRWLNTASAVSGTAPTTNLFVGTISSSGLCEISGVDLSALGTCPLVNVGVSGSGSLAIYFRNCTLGANAVVATGAVIGPGGCEVYLDNCDSAGTNYRFSHTKFSGVVVQETTKVRSGGASNGTTAESWSIATNTPGPTFYQPLETMPISAWNDTSGSAITVTLEFLHDSLTALTNADIWLQVEYAGSATAPLASFASNRAASALATPASHPSSAATWTTTGITNPNKQKMSVTFTPQMKGPLRARVLVAKAGYTVFVDPLLTIS